MKCTTVCRSVCSIFFPFLIVVVRGNFIVWKLERISCQLLWHKITELTIIVNEVVSRYFETLFKKKFRKKIFYSLARNREINECTKVFDKKMTKRTKKIISSNRTRLWIYDVFTILIFHSFTRRIAAFQSPRKNARRDAFFTAVHTAKRVRSSYTRNRE